MQPTVKTNAGFPPCVHLRITFNDHAVTYDSVGAWVRDTEDGGCWFDWVSPDDRARAIETDSVWTCQWYPETPVGFCALAAASFETLMRAVNAACSASPGETTHP